MPMTPQSKAAKSSRTAAERSLKLIIEAATAHLGTIREKGVPEASFMVHAIAYEKARVSLALLDTLGAGTAPDGDDGLVEVPGDDLDKLIEVVRAIVPANMLGPDEDNPLTRLAFAAWQSGNPQETGEQA
jgi:hypothetical protein